MAILLSGATGFIGKHLLSYLVKEYGEDQIFVLVRSITKWKKLGLPGTPIEGDLGSLDFSFLKKIPKDLKAVIHTAGLVHSHRVQDFYEVNTKGTEKLVVGLRDILAPDAPFHFIALSSLAAFGPGTVEENHEGKTPSPVSDYGLSKLKAEEAIQKLCPKHWLKTIIRPPMVMGPDDPATLDVFKIVAKGLYLKVGGSDGDKKLYTFVCVHDLVDMIGEVLKKAQKSESYFAGFPQAITYKELHEKVQEILKIPRLYTIPLPEFVLRNMAPMISRVHNRFSFLSPFLKNIRLTHDKIKEILPHHWCCSSKKFSQEYQFEFKWDLDKTLRNALASYKEKGLL